MTLIVRPGAPVKAKTRAHVLTCEPDIPPASAADLDELHHLALGEIDLSGGEGRVVSQDPVLGEGGPRRVHQISLTGAAIMMRVQRVRSEV